MSNTPILHLKNISIGTDASNLLVKNLSLQINEEEIHGLIGESGSGKSLTALSIVSLLPSSLKLIEGSINFQLEGKIIELNRISESQMRQIRGSKVGFIFQDPMTSLNPSMKCGEQVTEIFKLHKVELSNSKKEAVLELFEKVRISDPEKIFQSYPHEISGGQRQRVMIAMALACKPKLLIADEPTTALDVTVQKSIMDLINDLRRSEKLAVLFITHDLGFIAHYADRLSIMYKGQIVESGSKSSVIQNPEHRYTKGLLACKPPIDKRIHRLLTLDGQMNESNEVQKVVEESDRVKVSDKILEIKELNLYYKLNSNFIGQSKSEMHALKNITFSVNEGESLGLVGESGSGKSSLGRTLLRLVEERSGVISYKGIVLNDLSDKEFREYRKKIQFIFQDPFASLNPKKTIGQCLVEPMKVHNIKSSDSDRQELAFDLLKKVGLSSKDFHKYPHEFSGGQRQRIVIARALSLNPEFIICDEAVSALDVSVQAVILNLLKDLQEEFNLTYLFITHDMSVVRFFCDRLIVMKDGEIVEEGKADDIFKNAKEKFTRELIEASF